MPHILQTGDTQAICMQRHDSFIDRCIEVTDAALKRQAVAAEPAPIQTSGKSKKKNAA
jgi:hypothetical protein